MSHCETNSHIRCHVNKCAYHCDGKDFCSLNAIQVEPCGSDCKCSAQESTCCMSFKAK